MWRSDNQEFTNVNSYKHNIRYDMPTLNRICIGKPARTRNMFAFDSARYYNSRAWRELRNGYIRMHPLCERCLENGRSVEAKQVHHRVPFALGRNEDECWEILLTPENLESLCVECHCERHRELDRNVTLCKENALCEVRSRAAGI